MEFHALKNCLLKLFNNSILINGSYPTNWKKPYLSPVYTGETLDDPINLQRDINTCTCILIIQYYMYPLEASRQLFNTRELLNLAKIVFTKKTRTSDHMFVLRTFHKVFDSYNLYSINACLEKKLLPGKYHT